MLISALYEYGNYIEGFAPDGWEQYPISHRIVLGKDGSVTNIVDIRKEQQVPGTKKTTTKLVSESFLFPLRDAANGVSYLVEHRGTYLFGLSFEKGDFVEDKKTNKSHMSFVEVNSPFFEKVHSDICDAYMAFIKSCTPEMMKQNPFLLNLGKDFTTAHFGFCLEGLESPLEEDDAFKKAYSAYLAKKDTDSNIAFCSITGEQLPLENTHKAFRLPGSGATGNKLVSMNGEAYESYCKKQSFNANVSKKAATQYAKVLDYLISDKTHHKTIGDMTLVYFAMKKNDAPECSWFGDAMDMPNWMKQEATADANASLDNQFQNAAEGKVSEADLDKDATFYIIGMTANVSRVCIKFVWRNKFGQIVDNLKKHQADMQVKPGNLPNIDFYHIGKELVSPKASSTSSDSKPNPAVMTELMLAAINGTPYPQKLLSTVINRVKTDSGINPRNNLTRTGVIKACIVRNQRVKNQKEEISMSWNPENKNPAYLCGSLFAVYEKIQKDASSVKLNRTIKDSYFSSACSYPAAVMPRLERLSQNHFKKLRESAKVFYQKLINELMSGMEGKFPTSMLLEEQGTFIIGYHQMNDFLYTKRGADNDEESMEKKTESDDSCSMTSD